MGVSGAGPGGRGYGEKPRDAVGVEEASWSHSPFSIPVLVRRSRLQKFLPRHVDSVGGVPDVWAASVGVESARFSRPTRYSYSQGVFQYFVGFTLSLTREVCTTMLVAMLVCFC